MWMPLTLKMHKNETSMQRFINRLLCCMIFVFVFVFPSVFLLSSIVLLHFSLHIFPICFSIVFRLRDFSVIAVSWILLHSKWYKTSLLITNSLSFAFSRSSSALTYRILTKIFFFFFYQELKWNELNTILTPYNTIFALIIFLSWLIYVKFMAWTWW